MGLWRQQYPVLIEVKIQLNNELNHQLLSLKSLANGRQSKFNLNMDASWSGHKTFWMSLLANIRWTKGTLGNRTGWDISCGLHSKQPARGAEAQMPSRPKQAAATFSSGLSQWETLPYNTQTPSHTNTSRHTNWLEPFSLLQSYTQKLKVEETMKSWRLCRSQFLW